ncbi:MAG: radical SAM protein [Candidatus Sumerlaeota bacterium]|nr:radical SAM protein [Candidatus Sumerlaeota bacterium]
MFVSFANVICRKWNGALNRLSRRLLLSRVPGLPREVQIVPTNACNLFCRACPKTHHPTDNRHLSPEVYERVKRELFPAARILNLPGLGEPLLAPLFRQMVKDARAFGLKIKFATNAMRLDEDIMREIVMAGADATVSLDGARAETHEYFRTGSEFSVVIDALSKFHALQKKIRNPDFHISINTVVTKRNVEEIEDIIEVSAKYGVSRR